jgi:putative copper export protein
MHGTLLLLHVLGATVWTGGHLVLTLVVLPRVLRERDAAALLRFEAGYERIGIPALLIQVASGVWLAHLLVPEVGRWFAFDDPVGRLVGVKLTLLALTVALAADARLRIIPQLSPQTLGALAWHVVPVTVLAVLFVVVGVAFRSGWFY